MTNVDLNEYYGTKNIQAKPMNRADYNAFRGWDLPSDENGADEGYLVIYPDSDDNTTTYKGYVSWSPKEVFEAAYQRSNAMNFGHALKALKNGQKVARSGWNGKGMFLYFVPANSYPASRNTLETMAGIFKDDLVPYCSYIAMKTAQDNVVPWLASQTDVLADDWTIVE